MDKPEKKSVLKLGKGSRITLAIFSFLFALMCLPMAFDPPKPELGIINVLPSVFCLLVVGACILPRKWRGYCGDLISLSVITLAIWFIIVAYPNPEPGEDPLRFAATFGAFAVLHLWYRYGKPLFPKKSAADDEG